MDSSCWVPLRPLAVSQQAWHCTFTFMQGAEPGACQLGSKHCLEQLPCRRQLGSLLERCQHNNKHYHNCSKSVADPHT